MFEIIQNIAVWGTGFIVPVVITSMVMLKKVEKLEN